VPWSASKALGQTQKVLGGLGWQNMLPHGQIEAAGKVEVVESIDDFVGLVPSLLQCRVVIVLKDLCVAGLVVGAGGLVA